jgi:hypothetical protein
MIALLSSTIYTKLDELALHVGAIRESPEKYQLFSQKPHVGAIRESPEKYQPFSQKPPVGAIRESPEKYQPQNREN